MYLVFASYLPMVLEEWLVCPVKSLMCIGLSRYILNYNYIQNYFGVTVPTCMSCLQIIGLLNVFTPDRSFEEFQDL